MPQENEAVPLVHNPNPNSEDAVMLLVSPNNPYKKIYDSNKSVETPVSVVPIICDGELTDMDESLIDKAIELERSGRGVKILALFDWLINLVSCFWGSWVYAVFSVMSYCGYKGAKEFRRGYLWCYLCYLTLQLISRIIIGVYILSGDFKHNQIEPVEPHSGGHHHTHNTEIITQSNTNVLLVATVIVLFVQSVIYSYVYSFYKKLPLYENDRRIMSSVINS